MATVSLTARYLDQLKPQRTRFEVFDTLVPGLGDPRLAVRPRTGARVGRESAGHGVVVVAANTRTRSLRALQGALLGRLETLRTRELAQFVVRRRCLPIRTNLGEGFEQRFRIRGRRPILEDAR